MTNDINAPLHQVFICSVATLCTQVHALRGPFLSQAAKLSCMEWFQPCDGIFIKRGAEFVIKGNVEHILLTDSSSARQLFSRQGTGKVKHLSAKILWIQDQVRNGEIALSQISTAFNVADIGTQVLPAKRLKTLLRDIGIFDDDGANSIQAEERRGGDGRNLNQQMMQAARTIARLALLMGLEPTTGAMGSTVDECAIDISAGTCAHEVHDDDHSRLV